MAPSEIYTVPTSIDSSDNAAIHARGESNADACFRMAQLSLEQRPEYVKGAPHTPTATQQENAEFIAAQRLADTARFALKKLEGKV